MLWALSCSLASAIDFDSLSLFLSHPFFKFVVWVVLAAFLYHFVAGIRHLLMDVHIGESLRSGRLTAKIALGTSIVLIIIAGIWLW